MRVKMQRMMYRHIMTIMRLADVTDADLSTSQEWQPVAISVPCLLSSRTPDPAKAGEDVSSIAEVYKLFCSPSVDLQAGDLVSIEGRRYLAGQPFTYIRHQEALLRREVLASGAVERN